MSETFNVSVRLKAVGGGPRPLKVYFLTTMNAGVAFYRQYQYRTSMNRQGLAEAIMPWFHFDRHHVQEWQFHVQDDPQVYANQGILNRMCAEADVVIVQYLHSMEALALVEALKACYPKTVFLTEIDDYILEAPPYNEAHDSYQPGFKYREVVVEQMKALDGIIVSTPFLKEAYSEFNKHVYVVPNAIDFEIYDKLANSTFKEIRIGWIGGASHTEDLRLIEKPMKEFLKKHTNVFFYCVQGVPEFFRDQSRIVPILKWNWMNRYPKAMSKYGFDIGLAPLVDNSFNRAKSNLRKLEYAGLKIPVIASNVGHFAQTVHTGKDGFLFNNDQEFYKALELLVFNDKLRKAMGQYNYLDVKKNFNLDSVTRDYVDVLLEAHKRGQTTKVDVSPRSEKRGASKWTEGQPELLSA